jgi:D-psicose/D-tagatose/L-ribulose 3-epimerase
MKIGMNMFLWTTHMTMDHLPVLHQLKAAGYDGVEVPVLEATPAHYRALARVLDDIGLERTAVAIIPTADCNPAGAELRQRAAALEHLKLCVDRASAVGATILAGPTHSTLGLFSGTAPTELERAHSAEVLRNAGEYARGAGVTFALEALNRFECYLVNTMSDLSAFVRRIDHPNVQGMYDTFHANIEEKDLIGCIGDSFGCIRHVHISENDRGTPGRGHIPFDRVLATLRSAGYNGWLTIEAFSRALPGLAAAAKVWRDFFPLPDEVWREGIGVIRSGWSGAR